MNNGITLSVSANFYVQDENFLKVLKEILGERFEFENITEINCSNKQIKSLKGIEKFINLQKLDCSNNSITELDLSYLLHLTELQCRNNNIKYLDLRTLGKLEVIDCRDNPIESLQVSECATNNKVLLLRP